MTKNKVFVALSGGVDSSVALLLLKNKGYNVVGVYMKNWSGDDYGIQSDCPWEQDQKDAQEVCKTLNIEFKSFNFEKEYREKVVSYFFSEYKAGRTPNPDIMCNKEIKFNLFLKKAIENNADYIATGHYAQKKSIILKTSNKEFSANCLVRSKDQKKDQTYFLYTMTQEQLDKTIFPIGHLQKKEVREIALKYSLPNATKKDSQGICFIGEINVFSFLKKELGENRGDIVDVDTKKKVGEHMGIHFFTIGQREGINIGGLKIPYYVVGKDHNTNTLLVGAGKDHKSLFRKKIKLESFHFINEKIDINKYNESLNASIRHQQEPVKCQFDPKTMVVEFDTEIKGVAEGQSIVFYTQDICLGGGIISGYLFGR